MKPFDVQRDIQPFLDMLNQVFEIEKKLSRLTEENSISRNVRKLRAQFEDGVPIPVPAGLGEVRLVYHDPTGEPYNETRTDCDASIAGETAEDLQIVEVIKPIIRLQHKDTSLIVQRAVVVAQSITLTAPEA